MEVRRMPNSMSELYHHGIKGQEWGDRNGPPYPLDSNASVQAKKKKKSLITRIKNKKKGKQLQKAKAAKKAEREEKEKIINSGDAEKVKKIANKLSDEEMSRALTKVQFNATLDSYITGKKTETAKKGEQYLKTAASTLQTIGNMAESAGKVYNTLEKFGVVGGDSAETKKYNAIKQKNDLAKWAYEIEANNAKSKILKGKDQAKIDSLLNIGKGNNNDDKKKETDS